ncbi:MAG: hypothetical protein IAB81_02685 [Bacteroidetes bacterium]|uniref:Uncharacterized protein n=1 Tax=Candidatus Merdivivens pullicola TaxID=2840872 RepID=A0A9D9NGA9_9BACT|nr:hypothetical protein [Candidatus Merdivivens pullicola]
MDIRELRERQGWSLEKKIDHSLFTIETFLSRVDGKAVLKRKEKERQVFRPGDVLIGGVGQVVIYADVFKGGIVTYCGYERSLDHFTDRKDRGWGNISEFDHATEEQKAMLFAEIEKRGYVWDAEKLELRKRRWRAEKGEMYWHAEFGQDVTRAFPSVEMGREVDDFRYENGNYYSTRGKFLGI